MKHLSLRVEGGSCRRRIFSALALLLGVISFLPADPVIAYVHPAGMEAGKPGLVTVAGQGLKGASGLLWSGGLLDAELVSWTGAGGPLTKVQEEDLRELLIVLNRRAAAGYRDPPPLVPASLPSIPDFENPGSRSRSELDRLYRKYFDRETRPRSPMNEIAVFRVNVPQEAGQVSGELRIVCGSAVSAPVPFESGKLPEFREPERFALDPVPGVVPEASAPGSPAFPLAFPFVYNGQIFPGETDSVWIRAEKAVSLDISVQARALVPYLADAVPGWFQPVLEVRDAKGGVLAFADDDGRNPDPRLTLALPSAGTFEIRLRDSIYRGRHDFVYRLKVAGRAHSGGAVVSDGVPASDTAVPRRIGSASMTMSVRGVIARPGAVDLYSLEAGAGDMLSVSAESYPGDSLLDAVVGLYAPDGVRVILSDDVENRTRGLSTHHADATFMYPVTVSGTWTVAVGDAQGKGGARYGYRLTSGPPRPDFAVMTESSAVNLLPVAGKPGTRSASVVFTAVRRDGISGKIEVVPENLPRGFSLAGAVIPEGKDSVTAVLGFSGSLPGSPVRLSFLSRALVGTQVVKKPVTPCDRRMQAFAWMHLVPASDFLAGFAK